MAIGIQLSGPVPGHASSPDHSIEPTAFGVCSGQTLGKARTISNHETLHHPGAPEAVRFVRPHRRTPVACSDCATGASLNKAPSNKGCRGRQEAVLPKPLNPGCASKRP